MKSRELLILSLASREPVLVTIKNNNYIVNVAGKDAVLGQNGFKIIGSDTIHKYNVSEEGLEDIQDGLKLFSDFKWLLNETVCYVKVADYESTNYSFDYYLPTIDVARLRKDNVYRSRNLIFGASVEDREVVYAVGIKGYKDNYMDGCKLRDLSSRNELSKDIKKSYNYAKGVGVVD